MNQEIESNEYAIQPGFRLHKLEVLNWGTFNRHTWRINPSGANSLLTGDIGSGKSTLVDAITTLLVPYQKITYNKAAGAESKERSVYSYIRGAYKNEKVEHSAKAQDVYLRDENTYSVIAASFINQSINQQICLAQVFWIRNNKSEKFFVVSAKELSIKEHFSGFGTDISDLKKRLNKDHGTEVFDSFTDYSNKFRQFFGIRQPEALDLFYQTVSMKSVGNLTEFVREHMLGKTNINEKIDELVNRYEELTDAYNSVKKARQQLEMLKPLIENLMKHDKISDEIKELQDVLDASPLFFSLERVKLLKNSLRHQGEEYHSLTLTIREIEKDLEAGRERQRELKNLIENSETGQRLKSIEKDLHYLDKEVNEKKEAAGKYEKLCKALELSIHLEEETFRQQRVQVEELLKQCNRRLNEIRLELNGLNIPLHQKETEAEELRTELISLKSRKTLIPEKFLVLRLRTLEELNLREEELPFAGELIRVKERESAWEGAIERRLHDLGLSMLVPERHYQQLSKYVNQTNLRGKLVYFRVLERENSNRWEITEKSLVNKVEIKADSEFYEWLECELEEKHNYICCDTINEFRKEPYAITREGQIKSGKVRHEKDDRTNLLDRKNYILGWTNQDKIQALETELKAAEKQIADLKQQISSLETEEDITGKRKDTARDFLQYNDFSIINWKKSYLQLQELEEEKKALQESSKEIRDFEKQLKEAEKQIKHLEQLKTNKQKQWGSLEKQITEKVLRLREHLEKTGLDDQILSGYFNTEEDIFEDILEKTRLWLTIILPDNFISEHIGSFISSLVSDPLSLENIDKQEKYIQSHISGNGGLLEKKRISLQKLQESIIRVMADYRKEYPAETMEVDASIEAAADFRRIYDKLIADDIPKYESRFRQLLKEGTINGILIFKNQLELYEKEIQKKISDINQHLKDIDYNQGTYIKIVEDKVLSEDIKQFRLDLKNCLENIVGETDHYNEEKFLQVKKILDRFKGEKEEDRRWVARVTDVREWYTFGASERWKEDDVEKEFYSDSSGKSGGQKEKLAYTILASSIAFQFGLARNDPYSRSFRFVVIDEAFGRGSDDSTRYGLKLFETLNLQLLIVTPLQKINVIEEYINTVHFVSNPTGQNSMVRDITKEQYLKEKEVYFNSLQNTA